MLIRPFRTSFRRALVSRGVAPGSYSVPRWGVFRKKSGVQSFKENSAIFCLVVEHVVDMKNESPKGAFLNSQGQRPWKKGIRVVSPVGAE